MIITLAQIEVFLLILARLGGIFIVAPVFSARSIPAVIKVGMAIWIALVLWFVIPLEASLLPTTMPTLILALLSEVLIGFLIGFVCQVLFAIIEAAGNLMDLQMGLSVATYLDPTWGHVTTVVGRLTMYIALLTFLVMNGHHLLLSSLYQSFKALPIGGLLPIFRPGLAQQIIELGGHFWMSALQLAAPVILIIFLSDFTFGLVSRIAPQVNVFMLGFQVKPSLGLFGILICLPLIVRRIVDILPQMTEEVLKLFACLR